MLSPCKNELKQVSSRNMKLGLRLIKDKEVRSMSTVLKKGWEDLQNRYEFAKEHVNKETVLLYVSLTLLFLMALIIRLLPLLSHEVIMKANDPFSQLLSARFIVDHGLFEFFRWVDTQSWWPWGRAWGASQNIGTALSSVIPYLILQALGFDVPLELIAFVMPAILGALTVLAIYGLGKEVANRRVGLLAAFFLSISPGHIQRTVAGFYDNEAIGVLLMVLTFYFFIRALKKDSMPEAVITGLFLAALYGSWGASSYAMDLLAIFALTLLVFNKYSEKLFTVYSTTILVSLIFTILIPRLGAKHITSTSTLVPIGVIFLLAMVSIYRNFRHNISPEIRRYLTMGSLAGGSVAVIGALAYVLITGNLGPLQSKFVTTILPFLRDNTPILKSVAEHQIVTWASLFRNLYLLVILIPVGLYYVYQRPTERNIFLALYILTALYFAGSMVRLILILAPAASLFGAFALEETMKPFALAFHGKLALSKRKKHIYGKVSNERVAYAFLFIGIILSTYIVITMDQNRGAARNPASILTITWTGQKYEAGYDWQETLLWIENNAGPNAIGFFWWDYGYYVRGNTNMTILVDNATGNSTQIGNVGAAFMSTPDVALRILRKMHATHIIIVVGQGLTARGLDSDLGKVPWMVRIAEQDSDLVEINQSDYLEYDETGQFVRKYVNKFYTSLFWALLTTDISETLWTNIVGSPSPGGLGGQQSGYGPVRGAEIRGFAPEYKAYENVYQEAFFSAHQMVRVFKINYDAAPTVDILDPVTTTP